MAGTGAGDEIIQTLRGLKKIARLHVDQWEAAERIIDWSKTKNSMPHAIPVPALAAELIEGIKPNEYGWFFPSAVDPSRPVSGPLRNPPPNSSAASSSSTLSPALARVTAPVSPLGPDPTTTASNPSARDLKVTAG